MENPLRHMETTQKSPLGHSNPGPSCWPPLLRQINPSADCGDPWSDGRLPDTFEANYSPLTTRGHQILPERETNQVATQTKFRPSRSCSLPATLAVFYLLKRNKQRRHTSRGPSRTRIGVISLFMPHGRKKNWPCVPSERHLLVSHMEDFSPQVVMPI